MGWVIGIGKGIPFMTRGYNWVNYWANSNKVLFLGLYSDILDGKMPNKVVGSSDYLTVSGSIGSETYQCPNTQAYKDADTDYIWFKTNGTQRTTTTAELVGYDLQRTPVKYDDYAPHQIIAIMILKAGAILTSTERDNLFANMWLPILWDGVINGHGHIKANRVGQNLWTPETIIENILLDGNTVGWYEFDDLTTITKDISNLVSQWNCKAGTGHNLTSESTKRPTWESDGVLFNGVANCMRSSFAWSQPAMMYWVFKQISFTNNDRLWDGEPYARTYAAQSTASPRINFVAGGTTLVFLDCPLNTFGILRVLYNGVQNKAIWMNGIVRSVDNIGSANPDGITVGSHGSENSQYGHMQVKALILRKVVDTENNEKEIYNYLANKYGFELIP